MFIKNIQKCKKTYFSLPVPPSYPRVFVAESRAEMQFCEKRHDDMNRKTTQAYYTLAWLLETGAAPADFPACCRRLRVLPGALNEMIQCELGLSGEELLQLSSNLICDWPQK